MANAASRAALRLATLILEYGLCMAISTD
ncbi:hypothetical protein PENANT_c023G04704 [Penicillium antarcticum]|uniref:Uncharacterized protein n=1 Tax=Penicillium antarcticum TaxID=416450 RepID=A0A1V6PYW6_9EURO|nr:hypothetical protein PENANT_c023G04704 [Penicillium antarcticum]